MEIKHTIIENEDESRRASIAYDDEIADDVAYINIEFGKYDKDANWITNTELNNGFGWVDIDIYQIENLIETLQTIQDKINQRLI